MRVVIDTHQNELLVSDGGGEQRLALHSPEGFEVLSRLHTKVGWGQKYSYMFSWLGRPIIQLPEDVLRIQEVIWSLKPDVILETGVAHGGSLIFYASLCKVMGKGRVVGIDIEIRPHNRAAIEAHELAGYITLIEGSSTDASVVAAARGHVRAGDVSLVVLDSNHSYAHVRAELDAYAPLVSVGSYLVATDGIMRELGGVPGARPGWDTDNPARAARDFAEAHPDFVLECPSPPFHEGHVRETPTYWPDAWLRRVKAV
jgi:cephalosporin hydroxylase